MKLVLTDSMLSFVVFRALIQSLPLRVQNPALRAAADQNIWTELKPITLFVVTQVFSSGLDNEFRSIGEFSSQARGYVSLK